MDMPHVTLALDRLRETQLAHGIALENLTTRQDQIIGMIEDMKREREHESRGKRAISGMNFLMQTLRPAIHAGVIWGFTLLVMAYLANGGSLMTAATFLLGK